MSAPIKCHKVAGYWEAKAPGDYYFTEDRSHIGLFIPNTGFIQLPITPDNPRSWQFSGTDDCPTLKPSIRCMGEMADKWHGFLTDGFLVEC